MGYSSIYGLLCMIIYDVYLSLIGGSCSQLELYTSPDPSKRDLLFKQSNTANERHCTPLSSITIYPKHTQYQWFMMDSEKYELMPARVTLLKDKIKIFMPAIS